MFHKYDLNGYDYDNDTDDNDDDQNNNNNPVGTIIAAIQKQQAKKTARLPKNNISDPMGVMTHNYIKLAGVQANPAKRIVTLLSNKTKYDPKILSNMTDLLQTNRMEAIALMFEATIDCYQRGIKSDKYKQKYLQLLESVFKDISYNIIRSTLKVKIKSIAQEFHAAFCDADLDPYKADKVIRDRLNILNQQLQHQINDDYQFDVICPCLRHNLSPPCKIKNCPWRHVCRCGATDHIMTDKFCPNHHMDDEKFFKKIKGMNIYHAKRANKASKFDKLKQYNPLYSNNTSNNHPSINNRKDNTDGNGYNNKQRR
tara:strand:- start:1657 stop:2595 length:939 start_codon:yes stop_codon:yes gene_type:complete